MKNYIQTAKAYILARNNKELIIGVVVVAAAIAIIITVLSLVFNSSPKIVYQPARACELLTTAEATKLLGNRTIKTSSIEPMQYGDTTQSRCGYTDGSSETDTMVVAAIIVRSGINDKGVEQNKAEFSAGKPTKGIEAVTGVGDSAYFNQANGQLNVLDEKDWIIISYGIGASPETNSVENAVALARKALR